ncbi:MAG: HAMP domain-containing sensor histidine kinase [Breznakibacter sp.]
MKLIKRTYLLTSIWLIPVIAIGSVFSFYMIRYVVYEETDEFLSYEMERLVNYHRQFNDLPDFHRVASIVEGPRHEKPLYKDTLMLEPGDNEMIPYRELHFTINHKGKDITIVIRHLLPGNDDILEGSFFIIAGFTVLISLVLLAIVNYTSGRIWAPFYRTLRTITHHKITNAVPLFDPTGIDEFNTLNQSIKSLLSKISRDYKRTKEYNENASHELQTHLAMIRASTEALMNEYENDPGKMEKVQTIYNSTIKLSQVQKSLLLLSKIGNQEFRNPTPVGLHDVVVQSLSLFNEAIDLRQITLYKTIGYCTQVIDPGLAETLVGNLMKNAVKHNIDHGYIRVNLTQEALEIVNSGEKYSGNPQELLERFTTGNSGHWGIGLAIVKQVCELYDFEIAYTIADESEHRIRIFFGGK